MVCSDIFTIENNTLLHIVDYYSKFPVVKKTNGLLAENMIKVVKIVFAEFGLPKKIVSDVGTNFISEQTWKILQATEHKTGNYLIIPSPEQCTGRSMLKIHEAHHQ